MNKFLFLISVFIFSCQSNPRSEESDNVDDESAKMEENIAIKIYTYEKDGELKASAMPEIKKGSELYEFKRRFEYLLINKSLIHLPESMERRNEIFSLYPDTAALMEQYLNEFVKDSTLKTYFDHTSLAIDKADSKRTITYTQDEFLEVASKFFYCDKVFPDTSVQSHVCVGLNGVKEASWDKDYSLLEAICYEAIFSDLMKDTSALETSYLSKKKQASDLYKTSLTQLDQYLLEVRNELFMQMQNDPVLISILMNYYQKNKDNIAFLIVE